MLLPRIQSSVFPEIKLNLELSYCAFFQSSKKNYQRYFIHKTKTELYFFKVNINRQKKKKENDSRKGNLSTTAENKVEEISQKVKQKDK